MLRNNSLKAHSRSNSISRHFKASKPIFRTIFKRRNDTIPASQLYQDPPISRSQTKITTQSQVQFKADIQNQKLKQLDIRQYVKKMGAKKEPEIEKKQIQRVATEVNEVQNIRKTTRLPVQCSQITAQSILIESKGKNSVEELQNKIQNFVNQNMSYLKLQRRNFGLSKWSQLRKSCSLDKEVQDICEYFDDLAAQMGQNQSEKLADLNKKIYMLQKMLASQNAQSQLLKLQYYGWKNQRGNTASFSSKQLLNDASRLNQQNKPLIINRDHCQRTKQVSPLASTSITSFKKPSKEYYLASKEKKGSFSLNRQPMPRSSYSAQYFNYGHIPTYSYKADTIRQSPEASLAIKASTYQQEYKQKLGFMNKVGFKDLDCVKDKFKNTNISFMNCSKKPSFKCAENLKKKLKNAHNIEQIKQNNRLVVPRKGSEANLTNFMNLTSTEGFYKTEAKKSFNWHNTIVSHEDQDILRSQIKDKKLSRLKQTFKSLAIRN